MPKTFGGAGTGALVTRFAFRYGRGHGVSRPEVDPDRHVPGAASVPAPPDWRRLYEQARQRAEVAEARAEELKWAEVATRTEAGAWKSQFETARRKRLA